jgi:hypothetical protein
MKSNTSLFVGLAIAVLAVFTILDYFNIPFHISSLLWIIAFACVSAVFFFAYLVNGLRVWKWLYPACIFAALSEIVLILNVDRINDAWILVFGLASLITPSLVGYYINRQQRANLTILASSSI